MHRSAALLLLAFCSAAWAADAGLHLECKIVVPQRFLQTTATPPPGPPARLRYAYAYEAFWWHCVAIMAKDLTARCPGAASDPSAESVGAMDGSQAASGGIQALVGKYGSSKVQAYLRRLASPPSMLKSKLHGYFDGPPSL